ncbi:MAG: KilA-N domain-containing protein [Smithella sp.]
MGKNILQVGSAKIKTNENDMVSLTDIWKAAQVDGKAIGKMEPKQWSRRDIGSEAIVSVAKSLNVPVSHLYNVTRGKQGGTYAHILIATAYASYLHPDLATEINNTYLRAVSGDVTLADEIVDRATPEDQVKHLMRTAGVVQRKQFTTALANHEVNGKGFGICTNSIYTGLFDACAAELRKAKNLPEKSNVREHMSLQEIIQTAHAEMIAVRNMDATKARGTNECALVCEQAARKVASI